MIKNILPSFVRRSRFAHALIGLSIGALAVAAADRPNIVYILADDLGYGDLSCYGQKHLTTPNIDQLAAEGLRFTQHYSGSTVCAPTRAVLMTGLHTGHSPVRGNREIKPVGQSPMPADVLTLPRHLRKNGYVTGMFGKWGLGAPGSVSEPMEHFDRFFGYNCQRNAHTYYPTWLFDDAQKITLDGETYSHDLIHQKALTFVRENKDQPFFLYYSTAIPHAAMHLPKAYHDKYRAQFSQFEGVKGKYAGTVVDNPVAAFAGMLEKMDEGVGEIVDLLKELGLAENTLVIFTSDNGPHKEGGHRPEFFDSNGPLTGHKRSLTEGGIRAPMIAWWPGTVPKGQTTDHVSAHWDVFATVCDLAGIAAPKTDGISMVPTLTGKGDQAQHEYLYWEFYEGGGKKAARWGDWKAVQLNLNKGPNQPVAVYNLAKDIGEKNNLAKQHPKQVARAKAIFAEAREINPLWLFKYEQNAPKK